MKIKTSLFNSTTDDLTIVIDLLRASTTIIVALNNFNKVIPVNNDKIAFKIKEEYPDAILAGEKDLNTIEGYDITNSPKIIQDYVGDIFVINTTNGTKVLENIKNRNENVKVLVASDYGVPQRRRRAFFVGICKELNQTFDFDFIEKRPIVTVGDAISDLYGFDDEFKTLTVDDELDLDVKPLSE